MFRLAYCLTAAMFVCGCVGCNMFEFVDDSQMPDMTQAEMAEQGRFLDQSVIEELTTAKERVTELNMQVADLTSTNTALGSQIAQLRSERETHQYSVKVANQEVDSTQLELQDAAAKIQQLRDDLARLLDEVAAIDSAHTAEIDQLTRRLEDFLNQRATQTLPPQQTPPALRQPDAFSLPRAGQ